MNEDYIEAQASWKLHKLLQSFLYFRLKLWAYDTRNQNRNKNKHSNTTNTL